jgi:CHAD domain-containing protein
MSLTDRWSGFVRALAKCETRPGEKNVHDLRVAARRLIASLDLLEALVPDLPIRDLRLSLRRIIKQFGPLRDTQVHLIKARKLARKFPAFQIGLTVLKVRESVQLKDARKFFRAVNLPALERMLVAVQSGLAAYCVTQADAELDRAILRGALARAYVRTFVRKSPALTGTPRLVHEFRIALKKFRYLAELLYPVLGSGEEGRLKEMKALQTRVGRVHDQDILIAGLADIMRRYRKNAPDQYARLTELLQSERKHLMAGFAAGADRLDGLRPGSISTPEE